jgi:flagellar biosynthesis protein FlhG
LHPGDIHEGSLLKIRPHSELYRGEYKTKILHLGDKTWLIAMPEEKGRFIPLPVGTVIDVKFLHEQRPYFQSEIVARSFTGGRNLTITAPGSISRAGRKVKGHSGKEKRSRVIAFSSGKGGVGKSTIILNVALALQILGKKTCIIDADLGTANIDILLQLEAPYNLYHLIEGQREIEEIIVCGPQGLLLVPGGSGLEVLANLREWQFSRLITAFNKLESIVDYLLLDTGAGVSRNVTNFLLAADEIVLIATPDPHAIMDVYSLIKILKNYEVTSAIKLIVNMTEKEEEAYQVWNVISAASREFLGLPVEYLGLIPFSNVIALSVKKQEPFFLSYPKHKVSTNILKITRLLAGISLEKEERDSLPFIYRLRNIFLRNNNIPAS